MTARSRKAHLRLTGADGREWKVTFKPDFGGQFVGRPLHSRTSYIIPAAALVPVLEQGDSIGAIPKDDPRQLRFA